MSTLQRAQAELRVYELNLNRSLLGAQFIGLIHRFAQLLPQRLHFFRMRLESAFVNLLADPSSPGVRLVLRHRSSPARYADLPCIVCRSRCVAVAIFTNAHKLRFEALYLSRMVVCFVRGALRPDEEVGARQRDENERRHSDAEQLLQLGISCCTLLQAREHAAQIRHPALRITVALRC